MASMNDFDFTRKNIITYILNGTWKSVITQGLVTICFIPRLTTLKSTREECQMSNVHTTLFQNSFVLLSSPGAHLF